MTAPGRTTTAPRHRAAAAVAACLLVTVGSLVVLPAPRSTAQGADPTAGQTTAASVPAPADGSTFSLTVTPTRLVVAPDDIPAPHEVDITNGGSDPVTLTVAKRNFTGRRDGTLDFREDAPYAAADWVDLDRSTLVVAAGATETVTARIDVPDTPEPGDHQVSLVFLVPAGESEDNVRINRGIAIPIYVTVPGPVDPSAAVTALDAGGFTTGGPVQVRATVRNTGTVHRDFRGDDPLELRAAGSTDPFADFTVPRGATRDLTTTWDPPLFCICHPTVAITNPDGTTSSRSVRVIVVPLRLVGAAFGALLLAVIATKVTRRRYRGHVAEAAAALRAPVGATGG